MFHDKLDGKRGGRQCEKFNIPQLRQPHVPKGARFTARLCGGITRGGLREHFNQRGRPKILNGFAFRAIAIGNVFAAGCGIFINKPSPVNPNRGIFMRDHVD